MKGFWDGEGVYYTAWQRVERHLHGQGEKIKRRRRRKCDNYVKCKKSARSHVLAWYKKRFMGIFVYIDIGTVFSSLGI